jgi:hypothetical protein
MWYDKDTKAIMKGGVKMPRNNKGRGLRMRPLPRLSVFPKEVVLSEHALERLGEVAQKGITKEEVRRRLFSVPITNGNERSIYMLNNSGKFRQIIFIDNGSKRIIKTIVGEERAQYGLKVVGV